MPIMSIPEYANHRGVHERSIRRYLAEKHFRRQAISKQGRKITIDSRLADQDLDKSITSRKELLGVKPLPSVLRNATPAQKIRTSEMVGTAGLSFHDARTLAQRYKAALLKLELDEKTNRLVDAEGVKATAFNKARAVRDSIMNLPDRIAPILAAESDPIRVAHIILEELKTALEELSR